MSPEKKHIAILGPTGCGKSELALKAAEALDGEIVNCDSIQVYRGFDIGSAKPSREEQARVPHHLFDIIDWDTEFDAGTYANRARGVLSSLESKHIKGVVCGGTGLYFRALTGAQFHEDLPSDVALRKKLALRDNVSIRNLLVKLDPQRAQQIHANDRYRNERALELRILNKKPMSKVAPKIEEGLDQQFLIIVVEPERDVLRENLLLRVRRMFDQGLLDEVSRLLSQGVNPTCKPMQSIGYREAVACLQGRLSVDEAVTKIWQASCQYAKRQGTWFKKTRRDLTISGQGGWLKLEARCNELKR